MLLLGINAGCLAVHLVDLSGGSLLERDHPVGFPLGALDHFFHLAEPSEVIHRSAALVLGLDVGTDGAGNELLRDAPIMYQQICALLAG